MSLAPFSEVVADHAAMVLRVCRSMLGPTDADDAWSETFLAAMRSYPDLDEGSNVAGWLVTIARRKCIDAIRRRSRVAIPTDQGIDSAFTASPAHFDSLTSGLSARADRDGLVDVAFRYLDSPFGPLLLAATDIGVVRVAFASEDHDAVLADLARAVSPRILESPVRTDDAARQLEEYFAGRRHSFEVTVDLCLVHGFRRDVIAHLRDIPYGATASYAELAVTVGNPGAVRAVGSACAHNPVPVIVPCHRVVRSDGSIGNYLGGVEAKRSLLALEAA